MHVTYSHNVLEFAKQPHLIRRANNVRVNWKRVECITRATQKKIKQTKQNDEIKNKTVTIKLFFLCILYIIISLSIVGYCVFRSVQFHSVLALCRAICESVNRETSEQH